MRAFAAVALAMVLMNASPALAERDGQCGFDFCVTWPDQGWLSPRAGMERLQSWLGLQTASRQTSLADVLQRNSLAKHSAPTLGFAEFSTGFDLAAAVSFRF